ncbi:hypothetical protein Skr01_34480 [Sphaerisporangium krabiense]|uniref:Cytosine/adenosine deaminase-related metal-dependent hydrolase n=1 Tax=Sphaerisporangium krabiense TaxID=763782 RepID=A0A7W8Z2V0_9ACTN|nr:hypothetical protein [Sphaerisporangium krabiense]MBB5626442.1 cytosine/adenosine deaminase-related metal-dependent hydrolase [Sphaerisporangium krabiense]GII63363.1 hypothetical protein Skr01_34480 [Sphaerisporangium krabiense]
MDGKPITITLSADQALVLSDWLERLEADTALRRVVDDPAVWSALHTIGGTLDKSLTLIFSADYTDRLASARERLIEALGGFDPDTGEGSQV